MSNPARKWLRKLVPPPKERTVGKRRRKKSIIKAKYVEQNHWFYGLHLYKFLHILVEKLHKKQLCVIEFIASRKVDNIASEDREDEIKV